MPDDTINWQAHAEANARSANQMAALVSQQNYELALLQQRIAALEAQVQALQAAQDADDAATWVTTDNGMGA